MELSGTPQELWTWLARPGSDVNAMYHALKHIPSQLLAYQQACVFLLAGYYKQEGATFLDIGTAKGHSAAIMALASPRARVISLDPKQTAIEAAVRFTHPLKTVEVWQTTSTAHFKAYTGPQLSLIFVDGDHKHVDRDMPWWKWLRPGGLMLFHDYTGADGPSPSQNVVNTIDRMAIKLGHRPDVMIVDSDGTGMAGFYK